MDGQEITINGTRFGDVTVDAKSVIEFPRGLLGFEDYQRYVVIVPSAMEPFGHLQSLDEPGLSFVVVPPRMIFPHYKVEIDPREVAELCVASVADLMVLAVVTVPEDVARMSVNLQGPLLINRKNNRGKQVVLVHSHYTTRHYIEDEMHKWHKRDEEMAAVVQA